MTYQNKTQRIFFLDAIKAMGCLLVVILHSYSGGGRADYLLRIISAVAVPMFMGVSGFLLFFKDHKDEYFWLKMLKKYFVVLLFWLFLFSVYSYIHDRREGSYILFILLHSDGWLYWYLEVLVEILLVYPILSCIFRNRAACKLYMFYWIVFISLRQALMFYHIPPQLFNIIQLPLFQTQEYIGGTLFAHYPTECLGVFIVLGSFIKYLIDGGKYKKIYLYLFIFSIVSVIYMYFSSKKLLNQGMAMDMALQPVHLPVIILTMGVLLLMFRLCSYLPYRLQQCVCWLSDRSLGIYLFHEFVIGSIKNSISGLELFPVVRTSLCALIAVFLSVVFVSLIRVVLPPKWSYYIL